MCLINGSIHFSGEWVKPCQGLKINPSGCYCYCYNRRENEKLKQQQRLNEGLKFNPWWIIHSSKNNK
jgi:hypothetical protein